MKKQIKKSLSLFMAVMMLLSCWVWVAPEKAEAAGAEDGQYYVKIVINVNKYSEMVNTNNLKINYKTADGTDTSITVNPTKSLYQTNKNDVTFYEGYINGFPTGFDWTIKLDWKAGGTTLRLEQSRMYVGKDASSCTTNVITADNYEWSCGSFSFSGGDEATFSRGTNGDMYPKITTINNGPAATATVTVPKINTAAEDKKVFANNFSVKCYDQYGVRITGATELKDSLEYGLKTIENAALDLETFTKEDNGLWYENGNVYYNKDAQELMPGKSGTAYYLYAHFNSSRYGAKNQFLSAITLNYPTYTVSVNQDGSVPDLGAGMDMSDNNTQTGNWSYTGIYQSVAQVWPKGAASKEGYMFKGFWTVPQPTAGDAGYNALEADFAVPVSSDDFVSVYGGKKSDEAGYTPYVEKDGKKYYDAGIQWDATKNKEVLGDATFYGWWNAQDINVKFYDVDGTYLGSKTTKYGKKEAENWYPDPKDRYVAGSYEYQGFAKKWRDITGAEIPEGSYTFGPIASLSLTPIYETKTFTDKYTINFVNPLTGLNIDGNNQDNGVASGKYAYRHILEGDNIPKVTVPPAIAYNADYSYEFTGWSTQKPASGNYHIVAVDDTSFAENTDWVVREDATYYAVFRSTVKEYVVAFTYIDTTGTEKTDIKYVPYGSVIATPDNVNRTYAQGGFGYTLEGWNYNNNTALLGVDDTLVFNEENVALTEANLKGVEPEVPILFAADYSDGQPTPYTVTFKYKDAKGADDQIIEEVYHGSEIEAGTVEKLASTVPAQYDDGVALYTFSNKWIVTEGTADKAEYTAEEFTSFAPTSHVTFEAVYGEGVPFYTVTYHDGAAKYSERILAGSNVPAWMIQTGTNEDGEPIMEVYVPKDYTSETGTYKFAGWFDAEQTDETYATTNGTEYTTSSTVNGDLDLYPQFIFEPKKFEIKFVNYDGSVLGEAEVESGKSFKAAYDAAMSAAANTGKPADNTYHYSFIGWDYQVPENFLCEGKNMTYTAQYKAGYIYYEARWYNDEASMKNADFEWEVVGEDGYLAKTSYTYKGAVYAPSVDLVVPEGKIFEGWYYLKDGVETAYQRGMTITDSLSFYAKYKDAPVVYTVTAVVGGKTTDYKVAEGGDASVIGTPVDGFVDADKHNKFEGWFTTSDYAEGTEFALDTEINSDIKVYAKFTETAHNKNQKELISAPTYDAKGSEKVWCACNKEKTTETVEISMLTDTVKPTGTIYLGTQGKWSSTDEVFAKDDTNKYYANDDTDLILTINDKAGCADAGVEGHSCVNCVYNPAGTGIGIKTIRAFVSSDTFTAEQAEEAAKLAITIFTDAEQTLSNPNSANYTFKVDSFSEVDLVDGNEYIVYYYASDKANNILNTNVRTAKFVYDITAPEFTVDGDSNAATAGSTVTYCGKAVIKGIENDAVVTVNGEKVELTSAGISGTTAYTIKEAGNYIITVTDKAGNSTSKKIIVTDGHDEVTTSQAATCTAGGYEKVSCAVCGKVIKNEVIKSEGHKYSEVKTVAPTCTDKGYDVQTCSVCGVEVKTNEKPAAGHIHEKDENDALIYKEVTPATCCVEGKKISNCTVCGLDTKTETIPVDTENGHNYGAIKTLKPTCTENGEKYQNCKYCFEKKTVETLKALDHKDTGRYTKVTTEATCYSEGVETTYCKACAAEMSTAPVDMLDHTLILVKHVGENNDDAENYPNGYMQYECQVTGCGYKSEKEAIAAKATYTVTFKGEGDAVIATAKKTEGESITADDVYSKDEDNKYVLPEKESDNEFNYTFAGWKGTDGKVVKLPVEVTKNETYTVEFKATKRTYTHKFVIAAADAATAKSAEYVDFATIIGTYNSADKKPAAVPTKAATATHTYEFAGWANVNDTEGKIVTDFTMTEDATFVAKFTAVPVKYSVLFYDEDRTTVIWNTDVDGGKKAQYKKTEKVTVEGEEVERLVTPVKAADADKHYEFAGWKYGETTVAIGAEFGPISQTTRVYAAYTGNSHSFAIVNDAEKTWAATCSKAGQTTEKCSVCGKEKVTEVPVLEHIWETQADGSQKCSLCGEIKEAEAKLISVTVNESVTYGEATMPAVSEIKTFDKIKENTEFTYTAPEKAATAEYEFAFVCWVDENGDEVTDEAELKVTLGSENTTYTAVYTATVRVYNVSYIGADNKIIAGYTFEIPYGGVVPAAPADPVKESNENDHFTFDGWSVAAGTRVESDIAITAAFITERHDFKETDESVGATCEQAGGTVMRCECGKTTTVGGKPATGHKWVTERIEPTYDAIGYIIKTCANGCGKVEREEIPKLTYKDLVVTVVENGAPAANKTVGLYKDGTWVANQVTNKNGQAVFLDIEMGAYVLNVDNVGKNVTVNDDTAYTFNLSEGQGEDNNDNSGSTGCSCSCHRPGFWGMLFRFFHNIIKFFTGGIRCCADPDPKY